MLTQGTKKRNLFDFVICEEKTPTQAEIEHLSIHFLPHTPYFFKLSTEDGRTPSIRNGHESAYFRANVLITNKKKLNRSFPFLKKKLTIQQLNKN